MTIKILGSAACEGIPAAFCKCAVCGAARARGGKEFRTRSQALVDGDMLVDLPADTYAHALINNFSLADIKYLLITHSHCDHFYPTELTGRARHLVSGAMPEVLHIYGSPFIADRLTAEVGWLNTGGENVIVHAVMPFEPFYCGDKTVTALPADHNGRAGETPYIYLIESGGKALLYGTDTASVFDGVWAYLHKRGVTLDIVLLDGTRAGNTSEPGRHMNAADNAAVKARMLESGLANEQTRFVSTHFSHNGGWTHRDAVAHLSEYGIEAAYDGLQIEF